MKGRKTFSRNEADRIRHLLREKCDATPEQQKVIRNIIRAIGFYISDFRRKRSGFTPRDFDKLIAGGTIRIV